MTKLEIAEELVKNTTSKHLIGLIGQYSCLIDMIEKNKNGVDEVYDRLDDCITYIESSNFDITGWMLWEIPVHYAHVFFNPTTKKIFDLDVFDIGVVIPTYLDERGGERKAGSIDEAIEKYCE